MCTAWSSRTRNLIPSHFSLALPPLKYSEIPLRLLAKTLSNGILALACHHRSEYPLPSPALRWHAAAKRRGPHLYAAAANAPAEKLPTAQIFGVYTGSKLLAGVLRQPLAKSHDTENFSRTSCSTADQQLLSISKTSYISYRLQCISLKVVHVLRAEGANVVGWVGEGVPSHYM